MAKRVEVSERYRELIKQWTLDGIEEHGGQNAFGRYTERFLAQFGLPGFASGMFTRWKKGILKKGLDDDTLRRIGLLKGFSRDPLEAQQVAYKWLTGEDPPSTENEPVESIGFSDDVGSLGQALRYLDDAPAVDAKQIAIAAVSRLHDLSDGVEVSSSQENELSHVVSGYLDDPDHSINDLAMAAGVSSETIKRALQGLPITAEDCLSIGQTLDIPEKSLLQWGLLPTKRLRPTMKVDMASLPGTWIDAGVDRLIAIADESGLDDLPDELTEATLKELANKLPIYDLPEEACYSEGELLAIVQGLIHPRVNEADNYSPFVNALRQRMKTLSHSFHDVAVASRLPEKDVKRIIAVGGWAVGDENELQNSVQLAHLGYWYGDNGMRILSDLQGVADESATPEGQNSRSKSRNGLVG